MHKGQKHPYILNPDDYEDDEEQTLIDLVSFAGTKFKLGDIKLYKTDNAKNKDKDKSHIIETRNDLFNALDDESITYFLIDGVPIAAAASDAVFQVSIDLSQCGGCSELSVNYKKCDFFDEEGWNNLWQDLTNEIGNELKNNEWKTTMN